MILTESTFLVYAMHHYENPHCLDVEEFENDMKRFQYVKKLMNKYDTLGDLNERLILNHIIVLYNCFGNASTNMLFQYLRDYHIYLKSFLVYLDKLPATIECDGSMLDTSSFASDMRINSRLKRL